MESSVSQVLTLLILSFRALALCIIARLAPIFDISEAAPGETPDPVVWDALWISRLICCLWFIGLAAAFILCNRHPYDGIVESKEMNGRQALSEKNPVSLTRVDLAVVFSWVLLGVALCLSFSHQVRQSVTVEHSLMLLPFIFPALRRVFLFPFLPEICSDILSGTICCARRFVRQVPPAIWFHAMWPAALLLRSHRNAFLSNISAMGFVSVNTDGAIHCSSTGLCIFRLVLST